ncbi:MAG TPA: DUF5615 family PIN-like protein [Candidatus Paceibacterota bacterium]
MKLLLDQNLSHKLLLFLEELYPGSSHVRLVKLSTASDEEVWTYAKKNNFTLVTQDSDFYDRSLLLGFPPKVIWIQSGNTSTLNINKLLLDSVEAIKEFESNKEIGCLELY